MFLQANLPCGGLAQSFKAPASLPDPRSKSRRVRSRKGTQHCIWQVSSAAVGPTRDKQVALSTFSYVFSELVQYQTTKIRSAAELETNLEKLGKDLGK